MFQSVDWFWIGSIALRLFVAGVLGGIVGFEREYANQPAGLRTHILVCIGSALVMITADYLYVHYASTYSVSVDPARMGAQVISGIGFLGAGTILRNGNSVKGLTTAAGLWAVACIGLACGIGFYEGALIATALTVITLLLTRPLQRWHDSKHGDTVLILQLASFNRDVSSIIDKLVRSSASVTQFQILPDDEAGYRLRLSLRGCNKRQKDRLISSLSRMPDILSIRDEEK